MCSCVWCCSTGHFRGYMIRQQV
uniref:Uncharacterized protein n=1 Tax=Anguilla anguilla TaxID=7936 RepID=A0A0E9PU85_ANGAN